MNSMFGEWYRQAEIEPKSKELESRWRTIEALKSKTEVQFAADLAKLHFSIPDLPETFVQAFRQPFFDEDSTFRMSGNEVELRVLAGAVLGEMILKNDTFSDGVALLVIASAFPEFRKKVPLAELLETANKHLFARGLSVRHVQPKAKTALASLDANFATIKQALAANTSPMWTDVETILRTLAENIVKLNQSTDGRLMILQRQQEVLLEESNIIWWIFGGAVRESSKKYSDFSATDAALFAAKDLASLTHITPPPVASPVFLDRMIGTRASESVTVQQVAAVGIPELELIDPSLFPLSFCLAAARGGKNAKDAASATTKAFQLRTGGIEARMLSMQFYRELLAARFVQKKG